MEHLCTKYVQGEELEQQIKLEQQRDVSEELDVRVQRAKMHVHQ